MIIEIYIDKLASKPNTLSTFENGTESWVGIFKRLNNKNMYNKYMESLNLTVSS